MTMTLIAIILIGAVLATLFWPELSCWLPGARQDRLEGYCDGMGGRHPQYGRSEAYHAGYRMADHDAARLAHKAAMRKAVRHG